MFFLATLRRARMGLPIRGHSPGTAGRDGSSTGPPAFLSSESSMDQGTTASERITWEECPSCRRPAAVGWHDELIVEFDCPNGCGLTGAQTRALAATLGAGLDLGTTGTGPEQA